MISRSAGRYDALLLAGLTCALLVIFWQPIRVVLEAARTFENLHGLSLMPALVILTVVFLFQQQAKRQDAATHAATTAAEAAQAHARAGELEELVNLGRSLSEALDFDALREAAWQHMPALLRGRSCWILVREAARWRAVMGVTRITGHPVVPAHLQDLATEVVSRVDAEPGTTMVAVGRTVAFPMVAGGTTIGVVGVDADIESLGEPGSRMLAASTAVLAIAVRNVQLFNEIRESNVHDALTGCFTRAYARQVLDIEFKRAQRSGLPLSAIMFDLDHFKQINDKHGHLAGDAVLAGVGRQLREILRGADIKCRYGGEEFLLLLPDTPLAGAARVAESLRQDFAGMVVTWESRRVPVNASFGISAVRSGERDPQAVLARADSALYRAKHEGRNLVRL